MSNKTRTHQTDAANADQNSITDDPHSDPESTDTTTTVKARTDTEDKLWQALRANPNSTAAELSADAGIGRSTAAKILARWANDSNITRSPGIADDGRRAADLWSITNLDVPSATSDPEEAEHAADTDDNTATQPPDTSTETHETTTDGVVTLDAGLETAKPPVHNEDTSDEGKANRRRLPPGGLRGMVEDWLRDHVGEEYSPSAIGKALGRSSGAVANICGSSDDQELPGDVWVWSESEVAEVLTELESAGRVARVDSGGDGRWKAAERRRSRLPQGGLQGLVEDFLTGHPDDALSPHAIGTALGRSSGAVANALVRLTERGAAVQVSERPRRYSAALKE